MGALQAGLGAAAQRFARGHPVLVLSAGLCLTGVATGTAAAVALTQGVSWVNLSLQGAGVLLAAALCWVFTRHIGLALLAALAPVPGLIWAAPVSVGAHFDTVPILAYALALTVALFRVRIRIGHFLDEGDGQSPAPAAWMSLGLLLLLALLWFAASAAADAALQAVADSIAATVSVLLLLPLAMALLHFDENFAVRANRARERRYRFFAPLTGLCIPRWGLSFLGIGLVFLAMGWNGAGVAVHWAVLLRAAVSVVLIVAAGVVAGGWREGLAAGVTAAAVGMMVLWLAKFDARLSFAGVAALQITVLALFVTLHGERRAAVWRQDGDLPREARAAMLGDGAGPAFAALAALGACLPLALFLPGGVLAPLGLIAAFGGGVILAPAAVTGLEALVGRRCSVEELYGPGKPKK